MRDKFRRDNQEAKRNDMRLRKVLSQIAEPDFKRDGLSLERFTQRANTKLKEFGFTRTQLSGYKKTKWLDAWEEGIETPEQAAIHEQILLSRKGS